MPTEDVGDPVGPDLPSASLREVPCAVQAHGHGLHAVRRQALVQRAVGSNTATEPVVGEATGLPAGLEMCVEPVLADINTGDEGGHPARGL